MYVCLYELIILSVFVYVCLWVCVWVGIFVWPYWCWIKKIHWEKKEKKMLKYFTHFIWPSEENIICFNLHLSCLYYAFAYFIFFFFCNCILYTHLSFFCLPFVWLFINVSSTLRDVCMCVLFLAKLQQKPESTLGHSANRRDRPGRREIERGRGQNALSVGRG